MVVVFLSLVDMNKILNYVGVNSYVTNLKQIVE